MVIWVATWWRNCRFQIFFALLAPVAAGASVVLSLALNLAEGREVVALIVEYVLLARRQNRRVAEDAATKHG